MENGRENKILETSLQPKIQFETKDIAFSLISIGIAFFAIQMMIHDRGGVWVTALTTLFCLAVYIYGKLQNITLKRHHYGFLAYNLLLGLSFSFVENRFLMGTNGLFLFLSCMYWVLVLAGSRKNDCLDDQIIMDYLEGFLLRPFKDFAASLSIYQSIGKEKRTLKYIITGILVSLPIIFLVVTLLAGADLMFNQVVQQLADIISENVIADLLALIMAIPIGFYLFLCLYKNMRKTPVNSLPVSLSKGPDALFLTILIIFISIYLFFFGAAIYGYSEFTNGSFATQSLSSYAREGFFQLLAVSLINVCIFGFIKSFSRNSIWIRSGLTVIGVETLGLVLLGLAKMKLYIDAFGLTVLRFNTSWFMVLLFVCVGIFIAALWKPFNYFRLVFVLVGACMLFFSFRNSGQDIINYNYSRFQQAELEEMDVDVFYTLGTAVVPEAVDIYETTSNPHLKSRLEKYLTDMQFYISSTPNIVNLQRSRNLELIEKTLN